MQVATPQGKLRVPDKLLGVSKCGERVEKDRFEAGQGAEPYVIVKTWHMKTWAVSVTRQTGTCLVRGGGFAGFFRRG